MDHNALSIKFDCYQRLTVEYFRFLNFGLTECSMLVFFDSYSSQAFVLKMKPHVRLTLGVATPSLYKNSMKNEKIEEPMGSLNL